MGNPDWKKYYWLDMLKLCNNYVDSSHQLQTINYFTATPLNIGKQTRQQAFLNANNYINKGIFNVKLGKYILKDLSCQKCFKPFQIPEEKITDVNIATQILGDCYLKKVDRVVLVTADSDLLPPLRFLLDEIKSVKVKLIFPPNNFSSDLFNFMKERRQKVSFMERNESFFSNSMLPDIIETGRSKYTRPPNWT